MVNSLATVLAFLRSWVFQIGLGLVLPTLGQAEGVVETSPGRQIYLVEAVEGYLVLTYLFSLENSSATSKRFRFALNFPHEVEDWSPQEGLAREDIVLGAEGGIFVEKNFPPGRSFAALGLKIPGASGRVSLTFTPQVEMSEMLVLAKPGVYELSSPYLAFEPKKVLMGEAYDSLRKENIPAQTRFTVEVAGIPLGRTRLWVMGGLLGLILMVLAPLAFTLTRH